MLDGRRRRRRERVEVTSVHCALYWRNYPWLLGLALLHSTLLWSRVCTALHCAALCKLYCTVQHSTVLHCTALFSTVHHLALRCTALYREFSSRCCSRLSHRFSPLSWPGQTGARGNTAGWSAGWKTTL